jgi:hypothetical protein
LNYLETTLANANSIQEPANSTLNSESAWCETGTLALREELRLSVFVNRLLRRMFGPTQEVTGCWRKQQFDSENRYNLHSSQSNYKVIKLRRMKWTGNASSKGRGAMYTKS